MSSLAVIIRLMHYLVVVFVLLGWCLPSPIALQVHLLFVPLMVLHWKLNRNVCVLTNLERWLKGEPWHDEGDEGTFIKSMLATIMTEVPSDRVVAMGTYALISAAWFASLSRLGEVVQ